jgi:O-antigen/teichoic acid export membrane protein
LIRFLKKIASRIGVDKAIIYTSSARIIQAVGGIVTVLFVVKYLSGVEQGFYYTFGSIVAIQIFFELGLNGIITQYVAHEVSNLNWKDKISLDGESKYISRLSSLLHFSLKWYLAFAFVLLTTLLIIGIYFFHKYDTTNDTVNWTLPWIILSIGTSINLLIAPIMAFIEGLGKVKEMARIRLIQQIVGLVIVWGGLVFGARLFVPGISSLMAGFVLVFMLLIGGYAKLLNNIWKITITEKVHYRKEIFPYQWKIALSWISGYFIFQLFNPVLFATEGPIVAGQMGMTLAALNGILSLSLAWISTKVPLFSGFIAQKEYSKLDNVFNKTLKQSVMINFCALVFMAFMIFLIRFYHFEIGGKLLGDRFLAYRPMLFMMIPVFLNQFIASWATYLRCHKKEPFLLNSIVSGVLCSLSTVILGKYFGVIGLTAGYLVINILMFPWGYGIFKTKRSEWHRTLVDQ